MKNKKRGLFALFLAVFYSFLPAISLFGQTYSGLNLSADDRLLFNVQFEEQNAVFLSTLSDNTILQLTAYPEKLQITENGRAIIVQNRFGAVRIPSAGGLPSPIPGYPTFAEGKLPLMGRLLEIAASDDGRWVVYIEPVSPAYGTLYIVNASTGEKKTVTEKIELPARNSPVKWSPDSRLFVYEKNKTLFYFPIVSDLSVLIDERFRLIGQGGINSVTWGQNGDFFYFNGNTLYSIRNPELFTRTIYGDFLSAGNAAARLPFEFDSNFDKYWVAPDSKSILINKNDKGIFRFLLGETTAPASLLHIALNPGAENITVLWPVPDNAIIIYNARNNVIAAQISDADSRRNFILTSSPSSPDGILSPDGTKAVFFGEHGMELWDVNNWRLIQRIFSEPVLSCAWLNNERIITGNSRFISEVNIAGAQITQRRLCLSGANETGFEARGQRVLARSGSEWFAADARSGWLPIAEPQLRQVSAATERYRVFLENNVIMARDLQTIRTSPLLANHAAAGAFPRRDPLKIALCFDLYDDDTGLYQVLGALNRNGIKATFFLNGDFIRNNHAAVNAIAESGHEAGSMFYAPIDLADSRYRITRDFIARGLARNEDEYFNITGKELMSLWHPPFYRTSEFINSAALSAGYASIQRTLDLQDWVSSAESARLNIRQTPPAEMIETIVKQARNGEIIPIRLGLLSGGRSEYLYQRIDVLLDALARSGIDVVPVSQIAR